MFYCRSLPKISIGEDEGVHQNPQEQTHITYSHTHTTHNTHIVYIINITHYLSTHSPITYLHTHKNTHTQNKHSHSLHRSQTSHRPIYKVHTTLYKAVSTGKLIFVLDTGFSVKLLNGSLMFNKLI